MREETDKSTAVEGIAGLYVSAAGALCLYTISVPPRLPNKYLIDNRNTISSY